jgi:cytochrome c oxidase cbb3-type subunit 3
MPASALTTGEVWQVAAYVRTLGRVEGSKSPGNPRRGQQIYAGKGDCGRCHTIAGRGGAIGPDLADIGARQDAAYLRTSLLDPDASVPLEFLQVHVVTKDGRRMTAVRLNEDTFSIQVRDLSNQVHSFWKSELTEVVKEPKRSLMPSYKSVLTAEELDDLVSYLESLQGSR